MKRFISRNGRGFRKEAQEKLGREHGATIFYEAPKDAAAAVKAIRAKLEGGVLGMDGLRGLASSKSEVLRLLKILHDKGCASLDVSTGRRSDGKHGVELMAEFDVAMRHERAGGKEFSIEAGRKGGKIKFKNGEDKRTPRDTARSIWLDGRISTNAEALAKINSFGYSRDWGIRAAYKQLGTPKRRPGRRSTVN